jgi:hypothetical protein
VQPSQSTWLWRSTRCGLRGGAGTCSTRGKRLCSPARSAPSSCCARDRAVRVSRAHSRRCTSPPTNQGQRYCSWLHQSGNPNSYSRRSRSNGGGCQSAPRWSTTKAGGVRPLLTFATAQPLRRYQVVRRPFAGSPPLRCWCSTRPVGSAIRCMKRCALCWQPPTVNWLHLVHRLASGVGTGTPGNRVSGTPRLSGWVQLLQRRSAALRQSS